MELSEKESKNLDSFSAVNRKTIQNNHRKYTDTYSSSNQYNDRKSNENFNRKQSSNAENCRRCGRSSHIEDKCPAHESGLGMACSNVPLEYVVFAEGQLSDKYGHRHWSLCINYKQR